MPDCDPNATDDRGRTALHLASASAYFKGIELLHAGGVQVDARDAKGRTAMHASMATPDYAAETMAYLLQLGASPDIVDEEGKTPLHDAASLGSASCIAVLTNMASSSADSGKIHERALQQDHNGNTALHHAAAAGHAECCQILLEWMSAFRANADIVRKVLKLINEEGDTPVTARLVGGIFERG